MGRTSTASLRNGLWSCRLREATQKVSALKRRVEDMKTIINEMCLRFDIQPPDLRLRHYVPLSVSRKCWEGEIVDEEIPDGSPQLRDSLIREMIVNTDSPRRRYTEETKEFYATIYLRSPAAYKVLATVLPIPSPLTLKRLYKPPLASLSNAIESLDGARETLTRYRERYHVEMWPILGVLSVDACSHSDYFREPEKGRLAERTGIFEFLAQFAAGNSPAPQADPCNYSFLYYFQPIHPTLPCIPIFLCTERTGKAGARHSQLMGDLEQIAKDLGFVIIMKCADGDNEYYAEARASYERAIEVCGSFQEVEEIAILGREILAGLTLFGADMLHLLKNGRTRLLTNCVSLNVRYPSRIQASAISRVLDIPNECFNDRDINKMVDALPIMMFTFKNALRLMEAGLIQESIYFLFFAIFHGFFRANCSFVTRVGIGLQFIRLAHKYIDYVRWATEKGMCRCSAVRVRNGPVTLFTETHLQRMVVTVTVILSVMLVGSDGTVLGLNRCSTHPLENFFGLLRTCCLFKHTYTNIRDQIARAHFIRQVQHELGLPTKVNTRLNIAGQRVVIDKPSQGYRDVDMSLGIICMIDEYYGANELGVTERLDDVYETIHQFLLMLSQLELQDAHPQGKYSGLQIMNRLIANSQTHK